jgi:hypothetical protein
MIRKTALVVAAIAALGAASLTATPAAAKGGKGGGGFHHGHGHGHGHFFRCGIGLGLVAYDSCYRNVWAINRFGETVLRRVYVCG